MVDKDANIIINDVDLVENEIKNVSGITGITSGTVSLSMTTPSGTSGDIKITTNTESTGKAGNVEIVTGNGENSTEGGKISIHSGYQKENKGEVEIYGAATSRDKRYLRFQNKSGDVPYAKAKVDEAETLNVVIPDKSNLNSQCRLIWTANGLEIIREDLSSAE